MAALAERSFRRQGLAVSLIFILFLALLVYLKAQTNRGSAGGGRKCLEVLESNETSSHNTISCMLVALLAVDSAYLEKQRELEPRLSRRSDPKTRIQKTPAPKKPRVDYRNSLIKPTSMHKN